MEDIVTPHLMQPFMPPAQSILSTLLSLPDLLPCYFASFVELVRPNRQAFFRDGLGKKAEDFDTVLLHDFKPYVPKIHWDGEVQTISGTLTGFGEKIMDLRYGRFATPLPEKACCEADKTSTFAILTPNPEAITAGKIPPLKGMVIHFAGTGDEYLFARRKFIAEPLLRKYGIGSIILTFSGYAERRKNAINPLEAIAPATFQEFLNRFEVNVADGLCLLQYCKRAFPGVKLGVTGISQGGALSLLSAAIATDLDLAVSPCVISNNPEGLAIGALSRNVNFAALQRDFGTNTREETVHKFLELILRVTSITNTMELTKDHVGVRNYPARSVCMVNGDQDYFVGIRGVVPIENAFLELPKIKHFEIRYRPGGHLSTISLFFGDFVEAINTSFEKL
eukprot:Clim_evm90s156 gene=Clim_evmTU90s156